ncbi:unnamed protein product, partial [Symbiodinium sp. CCMP2456]
RWLRPSRRTRPSLTSTSATTQLVRWLWPLRRTRPSLTSTSATTELVLRAPRPRASGACSP